MPKTREEAIAIAHSAPEVIVKVLLQLSDRMEELERKIARLTGDSSEPSKAPSSDGPAAKPRARSRQKPLRRRAGGQPGHNGKNRDIVPSGGMGELVVLTPETCDHYGKVLGPKTVPGRARMSKWLQCHQERSDYSVRKSAKSLLRHSDGLFTFLEVGGVEPTNNPAESAPRPVVQWRKI